MAFRICCSVKREVSLKILKKNPLGCQGTTFSLLFIFNITFIKCRLIKSSLALFHIGRVGEYEYICKYLLSYDKTCQCEMIRKIAYIKYVKEG